MSHARRTIRPSVETLENRQLLAVGLLAQGITSQDPNRPHAFGGEIVANSNFLFAEHLDQVVRLSHQENGGANHQVLAISDQYKSALRRPTGYGDAMAVNDEHLVIGAPTAAVEFNANVGAVFVYDVDSLIPVVDLRNPANSANVEFGRNVAIENDVIVITAHEENDDRGVLYVYDNLQSGQPSRVINAPLESAGGFGSTISLDSGVLYATGNSDSAIWGYDVATGNLVATLKLPENVLTSAVTSITPFGSDKVAVSSARAVHLFDTITSLQEAEFSIETGAGMVAMGSQLLVSEQHDVILESGEVHIQNAGRVVVLDQALRPVNHIRNPAPKPLESFGQVMAVGGDNVFIRAGDSTTGLGRFEPDFAAVYHYGEILDPAYGVDHWRTFAGDEPMPVEWTFEVSQTGEYQLEVAIAGSSGWDVTTNAAVYANRSASGAIGRNGTINVGHLNRGVNVITLDALEVPSSAAMQSLRMNLRQTDGGNRLESTVNSLLVADMTDQTATELVGSGLNVVHLEEKVSALQGVVDLYEPHVFMQEHQRVSSFEADHGSWTVAHVDPNSAVGSRFDDGQMFVYYTANENGTISVGAIASTYQPEVNDVTVHVSSGYVVVNGDDNDNSLIVEQVSASQLTVTGAYGTTVNGEESVTIDAGRGLKVSLAGGNDQFSFTNVDGGYRRTFIDIRTGLGHDLVSMFNTSASGALFVNTGRDNDRVEVLDTIYHGYIHYLYLGDNDDQLVMERTNLIGTIVLDGGPNHDTLDLLATDIARANRHRFESAQVS